MPNSAFLIVNGRKIKMQASPNSKFQYTIYKIQKSTSFHFEAAGFTSNTYSIKVIERPSLLYFDSALIFPAYLKRKNETLKNAGNLVVPEGTKVIWTFNASGTDEIFLGFDKENQASKAVETANGKFKFEKSLKKSGDYFLRLKNDNAFNKEEIKYFIEVVPDLFPKITSTQLSDTAFYNNILVGGSIADDYGFSKLSLFYTISRKGLRACLKGQVK